MEEERPITSSKSSSKGNNKNFTISSANEETLARKTHFTRDEVVALINMYYEITSASGKMDRLTFRKVLYRTFDITDDFMLDRIFRVFDIGNDAVVDETEWVEGLSVLLKGTLEEQIVFCYDVYDINADRSLAREELFHCLKNCLIRTAGIEEDIEESIKDIVEISMRKLDLDRDGQITFLDFKNAVLGDPLLLEICGPILPSNRARLQFLSEFLENYGCNGKKKGNNSNGSKTRGERTPSEEKRSEVSP